MLLPFIQSFIGLYIYIYISYYYRVIEFYLYQIKNQNIVNMLLNVIPCSFFKSSVIFEIILLYFYVCVNICDSLYNFIDCFSYAYIIFTYYL